MAECKKCQRKIHWGRTSDGAAIPLDMVAPVYRFNPQTNDAIREPDCFVSHFCTCKFANDFSKSKSQPKQGEII